MKRRIRIAYLIDTISSDKAGTEKQLLNIIRRLDRDMFEVSLICLSQSPWMQSNALPCEVITLGYRGFLKPDFLTVLWRYLRVLERGRFDVVQTFFEDSIYVGFLGKILSKTEQSLIVSCRDLGLGADEPRYHRLYSKIKPLVLRSVDGVSTNALAIKSSIMQQGNVPSEKIHVIGNGLDLPLPPQETPSLFKDDSAVIWIGLAANLKPVKRIDVFLRAMAHLKAKGLGNRVRAVVLGEGRLRAELVQLANDLGVANLVHFAGAIDNVNDYLQCIDIGVLCSDKEGLPNAILEYMACGLPVAVTAVGGVSELIDDTNGIRVPAGDYVELGNALASLVSSASLRKELGANARDKVLKRSTWDIIMPQWERYYRSMRGRGASAC